MNHVIANTLADAKNQLCSGNKKAIILAGGTDLVLDIEEKKTQADTIVDIMRIPELKVITEEEGKIVIGSAVTLTEISESPLIKKYYPSLCKGARAVGSLQIRNVATLVGNIVSAQPAADAAMALAPLNPTFTIEGINGSRHLGIEEMYAGFGKSAINSTEEIVTFIRIPVPDPNEAASFHRLELRKSLSLPMLNVAAMAKVSNGITEYVRITMGPVGVGPKRALASEEWLKGKAFNEQNIKEAASLAISDAQPRSNPLRGSREYRLQTLPVLVKRILMDIADQLLVKQ